MSARRGASLRSCEVGPFVMEKEQVGPFVMEKEQELGESTGQ
ncbi:hypothetical protein ACFONI_17020 [Aeromonas media]